jgi:hypothetical protein
MFSYRAGFGKRWQSNVQIFISTAPDEHWLELRGDATSG